MNYLYDKFAEHFSLQYGSFSLVSTNWNDLFQFHKLEVFFASNFRSTADIGCTNFLITFTCTGNLKYEPISFSIPFQVENKLSQLMS